MPINRELDFERFRSPGVRVYAGRDRGRDVRRSADLDSLDRDETMVIVQIPDDTYSVNSSFFLGLFGPSIRKLGEEHFRAKYHFHGRDISRTIEACIAEALNTSSPI